jgi:hypothetical protein
VVRLPAQFPALFFTLVLCVSAAAAALTLWAYGNARTPFGYMVVGTLATTVGLAVVFVTLAARKRR